MSPAPPITPKPPFKVGLVEDEPSMREAWARIIGSFPDFACVGACVSGEEALRLLPALRPDVVLMDIFLPRMSGIECTAQLRALLPETQIVILTAIEDDELVFLALQAGADGYLLKRTKPADLRTALLDVLNGGAPMSSQIARRVVRYFRRTGEPGPEAARLSAREEEVLILLSKGYSNKEIASQLELSLDTVSSYLKLVYKKMRVHSRAEAVARYVASRSPPV